MVTDFHAPNFEKVDGAYCFWSVRGWVRAWVGGSHFFSFPSYLPFWSYGPLKIFEKNLVSRISQKVFKLEA